MTKPFAVAGMTLDELKNLLGNARRLNREDVIRDVLLEMTNRGAARSGDYAALKWNQQTASDALLPFRDISAAFEGNRRTAYTEAGGRKIGRAKDDPEWMWVDTYTAIKSPKINAVFVCYIPRPGDEAYFELHLSGETAARYSADNLADALDRWKSIASEAA